MKVEDVSQQVFSLNQNISRIRGQRDRVLAQFSDTILKISKLEDSLNQDKQIQDLLNITAQKIWIKTKGRVESLVDRALSSVFPDRNYKFLMDHEMKRGVPNVYFLVAEDGVEIDIWEEGGLGVADVIGFTLRVLFLACYRPKQAQMLMLDEPFSHIHNVDQKEYMVNASRFVRQIAKEMGIQIIVITGNPYLLAEADQVFKVDKVDGNSVVQDVTTRGAA